MRTPILAVALAAALACSGSDKSSGGTLSLGEVEPNDSPATATPLPVGGGVVVGAISPTGDVDYYSFTIPAGVIAQLDAATFDTSGVTCTGIDTVLRLYNSTPSQIAYDYDSGVDLCSLIHTQLAEGAYTLAVASQYGMTSFPYVLDVSVTPIPIAAETEPNDDGSVAAYTSDFSAANANGPFTSDVIITGAISPVGDEDVYAVRNPAGAPVTVEFRTYLGAVGVCSASGDTVLYVHNAAGTILASNDDYLGLCSYVTRTLAAGETVYVRVTDWGDNSTVAAYFLSIDFL